MDVYVSVMTAWKNAMVTMDKLVVGMSHSVHEGSVLLGLAAWHLYPDMIVLSSSSTEVKQNDPLVNPGGIVTIGLQGLHPESTQGIYWSLPLAYVRFYGDPVQAEASVSSDSSRVSMEHFLQVMLGALCTVWGLTGSEVKEGAKLIKLAWKCFLRGLDSLPESSHKPELIHTHWLKIMADAASYFLKSKGTEQESCRRLIALGQKRCNLLGVPSPYMVPIMGLRGDSYVRMIDHPEAKVMFLRNVAMEYQVPIDTLVIRIQVNGPGNLKLYEYLTVLPSRARSQGSPVFKRWIVAGSIDSTKSDWLQQNMEQVIELSEDVVDADIETLQDVSWFRWTNPPDFFENPPIVSEEVDADEESEEGAIGIFSRWNPFSSNAPGPVSFPKPVITFEPLFGDEKTAAIFRRVDRSDVSFNDSAVSLQELSGAFLGDRINPEAFVGHLAQIQPTSAYVPPSSDAEFSDPEAEALASLKSLETAFMVFKQLPSATISLHVISHPGLASTHWAMACEAPERGLESADLYLQSLLPHSINRKATFSCITFFESGGFNIDPLYLANVMAVSSGNSIFVAAPLLCDPAIEPASHGVQRIIGNVGRSGIAFLYPPESPKTKEWDLGFYQVVRHEEFDGRLDDCFQSTTLHLTFSGYEAPIDVGTHGGRFVDAFFLEAVVSIHDRGEWIADLDVLSTFESSLFYSLVDQPSCRDKAPIPIPDFSVVTIDSWKELIDRPTQVAVLRAHGNWLARLAAVSLSVRLGIPTVVFNDSCCWSCGEKMLKEIQNGTRRDASEAYHRPNNVIFIL
jgi:hypothetical protein